MDFQLYREPKETMSDLTWTIKNQKALAEIYRTNQKAVKLDKNRKEKDRVKQKKLKSNSTENQNTT